MEPSQESAALDEELVDEIVAETFPASDAPAWNATHAGGPVQRSVAPEPTPEAMRPLLRTDLERLSRSVPGAAEQRKHREDAIARAFLASGRSVIREPVDSEMLVRTLECEQIGSAREASCVIVGARYDNADVSGVAALLAVSRGLTGMLLQRNVRFVAFANTARASGADRYVERLSKSGDSVHAMLSLGRLDLARDHDASVLVVGNLASRQVVHRTARAFRMASRIGVRGLSLPSWLPGVGASDHASFWRYGWPAAMVLDGPLWRGHSRDAADVDRIAAAVPGLVAAVVRLTEA